MLWDHGGQGRQVLTWGYGLLRLVVEGVSWVLFSSLKACVTNIVYGLSHSGEGRRVVFHPIVKIRGTTSRFDRLGILENTIPVLGQHLELSAGGRPNYSGVNLIEYFDSLMLRVC